jgi:hypothetical protein
MLHTTAVLDLLRFELKFLEDGGYGRSPRTPWRAPLIFEDSPTCLNFENACRPHPCDECFLIQFVPQEKREETAPCRFVPLTEQGQTIEDLYRSGTQIELEEAMKSWLKREIAKLETSGASEAGLRGT